MKSVLRVMIAGAFAALAFAGLAQQLFPGNLAWTTVSGLIGAIVGFISVSPREFIEQFVKQHQKTMKEKNQRWEEDAEYHDLFRLAAKALTYRTVQWLFRYSWGLATMFLLVYLMVKDDPRNNLENGASNPLLFILYLGGALAIVKYNLRDFEVVYKDAIRNPNIYENDESLYDHLDGSYWADSLETSLTRWVQRTKKGVLRALIAPVFWATRIAQAWLIGASAGILMIIDFFCWCIRVFALTCRATASTGRWSAAAGGVIGGAISLVNHQDLLYTTLNGALVGGGIFMFAKGVTIILPTAIYKGRDRTLWTRLVDKAIPLFMNQAH